MKKGNERKKTCCNIVAYSKMRYLNHSDTFQLFSRF